jgi:hypothetical protein
MHKQIVDYLTPVLGEATASNMLRHYCAKMRMPAEDLTAGHLPEIAEAMKPMLAVWLGSAGAARVALEISQLGRGVAAK